MIRFVSISLLTTMFLMSCNSDSERLQKRVNHLEQQLIQCKLELEKTQNPPDKLLQDAKDLAKAKKYSEAIEIFNKVLELYPESKQASTANEEKEKTWKLRIDEVRNGASSKNDNYVGEWSSSDKNFPNYVRIESKGTTYEITYKWLNSDYEDANNFVLKQANRTKASSGVRYDYENNSGEYILVDKNKKLTLYDKDGIIKEFRK